MESAVSIIDAYFWSIEMFNLYVKVASALLVLKKK